MLQSVDTTLESAGEGLAPDVDLGDALVQHFEDLTAKKLIAVKSLACERNRRDFSSIADGFESLIGHHRDGAEELQRRQAARFGYGHADVPAGLYPVADPPACRGD